MVRVGADQYNMYVRYGSKKRSDHDSSYMNGDEATEVLSAADIVLMLSGRKLGSVLDSLFPEKYEADNKFLEWLDPEVSMQEMSPVKFAALLDDLSGRLSNIFKDADKSERDDQRKILMRDFVSDLNSLARQIRMRAKVVSPNA